MIKGITVQLHTKTQNGYDGFGNPIYTESQVPVDNVLVSPVDAEDALNELNLNGVHVVYQLGIPKGDTHEWRDTKVSFFGKTFKTIGEPVEGIEDMIPLMWNKKIKVEVYE